MPSTRQPNVLVVFADQFRASALHYAGNADIHTPNIDQLAENGAQFETACANYPLCTPSRASIVTGQHAQSNTVITNDLPLPTSAPSVAEELTDAGYECGYIGKWHLDGVPRDKWTPPGERRHGFDGYWAAYNCAHDYFDGPYYTDTAEPQIFDGYEPVGQTDLAIDFLADADNPFCLFLAWGPPHDPYELVPERYRSQYDPSELSVRPNIDPILPSEFPPDTNRPSDSSHPSPSMLFAPPIREWETGDRCPYTGPRSVLADYYAAVTALDEQVGRLIEELEQAGIFEDTILIFTSDHGDMLWSQGLNQKGSPFDESIRIPFIAHWPESIPSHDISTDIISTVDFAPTILGLTGISPPDSMDGTDLSSVVTGDTTGIKDTALIYNIRQEWRGLRTLDETYVRLREGAFEHLPNGGSDWLFFHNDTDPYQLRNRIFERSSTTRRAELNDMLENRLQVLGDSFESFESHVREADVVSEWNEREREMHPDDPKLVR